MAAQAQRQPGGRRDEMGDGREWEKDMEQWPEDKPNGQDFDFYALFPFSELVPSPAHLIIGQRPKQFKKALYIYWQNGGVTTLAEDMLAARVDCLT